MIIYPSIDKLLDRINSKYSLVSIAAKRAVELQTDKNPMLNEYKSPKFVGQALEEIASNDLVIDPDSLTQK
ncbi:MULTISPECIES: DNA-directed RNA polymerase subunit omega [Aerococcus]|jgi:DNA-directed RNA polymerase subunit omega|uniref:DNA-directed RNA polymerase subunit omega n=1 Tax=Aerococcus agrisoli TaxID=2487350 RepID=A0A3N4GFR7_9LACT|nr:MULTISPECIES: DNA-directed RNA polymerase subunit omega [Aerococcus]OYQ65548.1 DNA-directed RNA polymerase subunit omega [Aerococcus sp. 1KP-2016]RPA60718.1 DNA-directed RNA polymerase subunit omega [Aerococcus agrisoli]